MIPLQRATGKKSIYQLTSMARRKPRQGFNYFSIFGTQRITPLGV